MSETPKFAKEANEIWLAIEQGMADKNQCEWFGKWVSWVAGLTDPPDAPPKVA